MVKKRQDKSGSEANKEHENASEKEPRRKRVLPKQPIPAADPIGTGIAVFGILLLIFACFSNVREVTGAPGVGGLIAGAVISLGFAVLYRRFTLTFYLILVLICGACATLAELGARYHW